MDTDTLVEDRIDDGLRLIRRLAAERFDVSVVCWIRTSEEGNWFLYIASNAVDEKGLAAAYRDVNRVIGSVPGELKSKVKLVGLENPVAKDVLRIRESYADKSLPIRYSGTPLGDVAIEEAYIYPLQATAQGVTFMNSSEVELLVGEAVRNTAYRLKIPDALFFSVNELRQQIKLKDHKTSDLLEAFISAYWQWFDFHRRIESLGKQG